MPTQIDILSGLKNSKTLLDRFDGIKFNSLLRCFFFLEKSCFYCNFLIFKALIGLLRQRCNTKQSRVIFISNSKNNFLLFLIIKFFLKIILDHKSSRL